MRVMSSGIGSVNGSGNGRGRHSASLGQILASLDRAQLFKSIAQLQRRLAQLTMIHDLLRGELHRRMSSPPATNGQDNELMKVSDVATALKVSKARAHELTRTQVIPSVRIGVRQIRVRRSDLDQYLQAQTRDRTVGMSANE